MITRSKVGIIENQTLGMFFKSIVSHHELVTVFKAHKHEGWTSAMHEEMDNYEETNTFTLVSRTSDG